MNPRALLALTLVTITSCDPVASPTSVERGDESPPSALSVLDGRAEGGNSGFFWLAPVVKKPASVSGNFDPSLLAFLTVEVCELDGDTCASDPLRSFTHEGKGSERLRIEEEGGNPHYIVNWHTRSGDFRPGDTYRISVKAGPIELGHADVFGVSKPKDGRGIDESEFILLKPGSTLPITFTVQEGALALSGGAIVGPGGGSVRSTDAGAMTITFEPGTLGGPALVTIAALRSLPNIPADWLPMDEYYDVKLSGGPFLGDALVELSIKDIDEDGLVDGALLPPALGALRVSDPVLGWVTPTQTLDPQAGLISVRTNHFSVWSLQFGPIASSTGGGNYAYVEGGDFKEAGKTFPVVGANAYELATLGVTDIRTIRKEAQDNLGATVVRVWAFPGQRLDVVSVLREAQAKNMKVIFALINNWNHFSGVGGMDVMVRECQPNNLKHDAFYTNSGCREKYKRHVLDLVTKVNSSTYGSALLAWELANEPRCHAVTVEDPDALRASTGCDPQNAEPIVTWVKEMAKYVRANDPYHLISAGEEGLSDQMVLRITVETPVDFGTIHVYPDYANQNGTAQIATNYVRSRIDAGARAALFGHKPVIMEEFGLTDTAPGLFDIRDSLYSEWLAYANDRLSGWLVWQLLKNSNDDDESLALESPRDDATIAAVREAACEARSETELTCSGGGGETEYREDFNGPGLPSGWFVIGGTWSVGGGILTGRGIHSSSNGEVLVRTNSNGAPTTISTRILNSPGLPWGAAGLTFNWNNAASQYTFEIRTQNPNWSATITHIHSGVEDVLGSCPFGLVQVNTWYTLELTDMGASLRGRVFDGSGTNVLCTMNIPGASIDGNQFGVRAFWAGGDTRVDWIETN